MTTASLQHRLSSPSAPSRLAVRRDLAHRATPDDAVVASSYDVLTPVPAEGGRAE